MPSNHGFPSAGLRPRVNNTTHHHPQQQLTVETMEQPLPQQHHISTSTSAAGPHHLGEGDTSMNNIHTMMNPDAFSSGEGLPSEAQLVLICLDYLRDLRRAYPAQDLQDIEGLNADYLSVAVFALSRCFTRPEALAGNNDCMMDLMKQPPFSLSPSSPRHLHLHGSSSSNSKQHTSSSTATAVGPLIPSLDEVNHEILYVENPHMSDDEDGDQKKDDVDTSDPYSWYDYDDMHPSNVHRFYPLSGLASGPSLKGPLTLGEITAAGLAGLGARSRLDAENDMIQSPLFEQFVQAVKSKGFFMDPDNDTPLSDPEEERLRILRQQKNYDERYRKVVAKFRTKLAVKAETPSKAGTPMGSTGNTPSASTPVKAANWLALSSADRQRRRREQALEQARWKKSGGTPHQQQTTTPDRRAAHPSPRVSPHALNITPVRASEGGGMDCLTPRSPHVVDHPVDIEGAERAKADGNVFMQKKLYPQAVQSYTQALKISPNGPHSHVYFSNRAAALLSMKKFGDAILDSERSLALKPDYGKAHARLGLAHFLSGNYRQSMEAYTVSLKYDPNNASSKSYLEKAAKRFAEGGSSSQHGGPIQSSFSLVSEWETSQRQQQQSQRSPSPHHSQRSSSPHHSQRSFSPHNGRHQQSPGRVPQAVATPESSDDKQDLQRESEKWKAKGNAVSSQHNCTGFEYWNTLKGKSLLTHVPTFLFVVFSSWLTEITHRHWTLTRKLSSALPMDHSLMFTTPTVPQLCVI